LNKADVEETRLEPKVVLLVRLLSAIDEGRHGFEDLKERIADGKPPSTRSLRRYLAVLSDAGFPWYFDRASGTYRFADGYSLKRLNLSQSELFGLVTLKRLGNSLGGTIAASIDEVTTRLVDSSDSRTANALGVQPSFAIRVGEIALEPAVEVTFTRLQEAERAKRRAAFTYVDKAGVTTERRVDPYGFIVSSGRVYLVGYDHTRNDMRVFAVDNISAPEILPATFEKPRDFNLEAYGANSVSGVRHATELFTVVVRFSPIVAKAARAAAVARERTITAHDDGSLEIAYRVADPVEIVRWSFGWGAEAEVVAPDDARATARAIARKLGERYAG
jgi:predicted DNA-binding transcriptional regulator YafY